MPRSSTAHANASPESGPARSPAAAASKRERILDAAIHVFASKGYHGSRIADIASEAGIAYGLVYHYFRNKEEILDSIFQERWVGFLDKLAEIEAQPVSTRDKLTSVATLILGAYHLHPDWVKVLVLEIQRSSRFARPDELRAVGQFFKRVTRMLAAGQQSGELRQDLDPELASYLFIGGLEIVITGVVLNLINPDASQAGERRYYERAAQTIVDVFWSGVAAKGGRE